MALKPIKTLNFGGEDTYYLKPEWKNIAETTVMGDTLTWDGNTDGTADISGINAYKVSDDVLTVDQLNNAVFTVTDGTQEMSMTGVELASMFGWSFADDNGCIHFINTEGNGQDVLIMVFTVDNEEGSAGVYFSKMDSTYIKSLKLPDTTETTPLPNKYLDFIETVDGDTLTWDGDASGLVGAMDMVYKLSSATPSLGDFANGGTFVFCDTVTETFTSDNAVEMGSNCIAIMLGGVQPVVIITTEDNADLGDGLIIAEKGTYLLGADMGNGYEWVSSLTINGYTGFTKTQIKEEYVKDVILAVLEEKGLLS